MADELKGRHVNSRDEEVAETPWGPDIPTYRAKALSPGMRAAIQRYRLARAALRGVGSSDVPIEAVDPVTPIRPVRRFRDFRI